MITFSFHLHSCLIPEYALFLKQISVGSGSRNQHGLKSLGTVFIFPSIWVWGRRLWIDQMHLRLPASRISHFYTHGKVIQQSAVSVGSNHLLQVLRSTELVRYFILQCLYKPLFLSTWFTNRGLICACLKIQVTFISLSTYFTSWIKILFNKYKHFPLFVFLQRARSFCCTTERNCLLSLSLLGGNVHVYLVRPTNTLKDEKPKYFCFDFTMHLYSLQCNIGEPV